MEKVVRKKQMIYFYTAVPVKRYNRTVGIVALLNHLHSVKDKPAQPVS